jgi:radical SAM protein with 4Fe4S-binding SPASM domain
MNNFCILPFIHLSTRVNGSVAPCCRSMETLGNVQESSIEEIWNNERMQQLRQQFLDDERPEHCWPCWKLEDQGGSSMRQGMNKTREHMMPETLSQIMPYSVPVLELKLSNLCNFRCRTCKPDLSTTWMKDWDKVSSEWESAGYNTYTGRQENYDNDKFLEDIERLGPSLEIIEFAGGEPLMDPMHYKVLEALQPYAHNIQVKYSTNLSKLTYGRYNALDAWTAFKGVDVSLSLDGYPDLNDYIRTESNASVIKENLNAVRNVLGNKFDGRVALCYNAWNAVGLTETYEYFDKELDIQIHGNIAWDPKFISAQVLPLELKRNITKKYMSYLDSVKTTDYRFKRIKRFITTNVNYLNATDNSHLFDQFIRYSQKLDTSRGTDIFKVIPELEKYV